MNEKNRKEYYARANSKLTLEEVPEIKRLAENASSYSNFIESVIQFFRISENRKELFYEIIKEAIILKEKGIIISWITLKESLNKKGISFGDTERMYFKERAQKKKLGIISIICLLVECRKIDFIGEGIIDNKNIYQNHHLKDAPKIDDLPEIKKLAQQASSYDEFIRLVVEYLEFKNWSKSFYDCVMATINEEGKIPTYDMVKRVLKQEGKEPNMESIKTDFNKKVRDKGIKNGFITFLFVLASYSDYTFPLQELDENLPLSLQDIILEIDRNQTCDNKVKSVLNKMGITDNIVIKTILFAIDSDDPNLFWKQVSTKLKYDKWVLRMRVSESINNFFESKNEKYIKVWDFIQILRKCFKT